MESIDLNKEELKRFFDKYNTLELADIKKLLQYTSGKEMSDIFIMLYTPELSVCRCHHPN